MTTSVLIGYDGSEAADRALRAARDVLSARRAVIVTVWESSLPILVDTGVGEMGSPTLIADPSTAFVLDDAAENNGHRVVAQGVRLARSLGFTEVTDIVVPDASNVAGTLVELAEEHGAGAIVVGSHGHSRMYARLMGTTSASLVRHARCPVLVVPSR